MLVRVALWALLALVGATLVGCQPDPRVAGSSSSDQGGGRVAAVVRWIRSVGEEREQAGSVRPTDPTPRPTITPTITTTPTRTLTPTVTPTGTVTPIRTLTPTVTSTPRGTATPRGRAPDLAASAAAFQRQRSYRIRITGTSDLLEEVVVPDQAHFVLYGPTVNEVVVKGTDVFTRIGSFWVRVLQPPIEVADRFEKKVPQMVAFRGRPFRALEPQRLRAGRCEDWDLTDNRPSEPISICLGIVDNLPYRFTFAGGLNVELYDYGAQIDVPEPAPLKE